MDNMDYGNRVKNMHHLKDTVLGLNADGGDFAPAHLFDKFNEQEFTKAIEDDVISKSTSRLYPGLVVYKYSKMTPVYKRWNDVSLRNRGAVVDDSTGQILGRGFNKFFNLSELDFYGIEVDKHAENIVMDKMDGSLGIAFKHNGSWIVSTAGSLDSDQAERATKLLNERYGSTPYVEGMSLMLEIIYPETVLSLTTRVWMILSY